MKRGIGQKLCTLAAQTWWLLASAGCDQHLEIGSVLDAAERGERDAGERALGEADDVWLRSHGRDHVSRLVAPCVGECSRVEVHRELDAAPLAVTWSDGVTGAARELCVTGSVLLSARVEGDAMSDLRTPLTLELATDHCDGKIPSGLPWLVCQRLPLREQPSACGADPATVGKVYSLAGIGSSEPASVRLMFRVPTAVTGAMELESASSGCQKRQLIASSALRFGAYDVGEVWFEIYRPQLAALLVLRASDGAGTLLEGVHLEVLEVCETL